MIINDMTKTITFDIWEVYLVRNYIKYHIKKENVKDWTLSVCKWNSTEKETIEGEAINTFLEQSSKSALKTR